MNRNVKKEEPTYVFVLYMTSPSMDEIIGVYTEYNKAFEARKKFLEEKEIYRPSKISYLIVMKELKWDGSSYYFLAAVDKSSCLRVD